MHSGDDPELTPDLSAPTRGHKYKYIGNRLPVNIVSLQACLFVFPLQSPHHVPLVHPVTYIPRLLTSLCP